MTSYNLRVNGSIVIPGITYLSYAVRNLTPSTTYTFEVQAVSSSGVSAWTTPVSATTASPLSTPTIASVQAVSQTQINVFWNSAPAGESVTSYNLRVNGTDVISGITYLSYAVRNLAPNTTYTFEVQAVGAAGVSNWSPPSQARTLCATCTPDTIASKVFSPDFVVVGINGGWLNPYETADDSISSGRENSLNPHLPDWVRHFLSGQLL